MPFAFVRGGLVGVAVDHLTYGHGAYFKLIEEWSCSPEGKWTKLYPMGKGYDYTHPRKMIAPVQAD